MKKLAFGLVFLYFLVLHSPDVSAAPPPELSYLNNLNVQFTDSAPVISNLPQYVPDEIIVKFKESAANKLQQQSQFHNTPDKLNLTPSLNSLNQKYKLKSIKSPFANFKANQKRLENLFQKDKTLLTEKEKHLLKRLSRAPQNVTVPQLDSIFKLKIKLQKGQSLDDALQEYRNNPDVELAEFNYIFSINLDPNDPAFPIQWPLNNTGQMYPASGKYNSPPGLPDSDIDAPQAWDIYTSNNDVIVAVVDTGVDYNHRDLAGNIWVNNLELNGFAGVDDDENGYTDDIYGYDFINKDSNPIDDHGHGTHCAGIIAAKGNNGLDISGVCHNVSIMSLKFIGADGYGYTSDAMEAFYYAVENGADVLSNSWGGDPFSQIFQNVIDYAYSQAVILVAAAGNDSESSLHYPAAYNHVISVAATNSNDEKAPFTNFGNWVDIAAPGVDILSLRATGTSMGTVYDSYKTIASGTSMACPHIAGACALLIATNPALSNDDVNNIIRQTGDPIAPNICGSNARLNIFNAILATTSPKGSIRLDKDYYSCLDSINIWLADSDLDTNSPQDVNIITSAGDIETISLTNTIPDIGIFTATISTASGNPNIRDGTLQLAHDLLITVTYHDVNDSNGASTDVNDTATADCQPPVIYNLQMDTPGPNPTITFDTNESTTAKVYIGLSCTDPNTFVKVDLTLSTFHSFILTGVAPSTTYYFKIHATDAAGNLTIDDNNSFCYAFTTTGPGDIYVPTDYSTIQQAIDKSWDAGRVLIADGNYTGDGNRDIDFKGKAITVKSINGPQNCIIDCNGTEAERHRGFNFISGENQDSVLEGLTIKNGYGHDTIIIIFISPAGNAIYCENSVRPTIKNCWITENKGGRGAIFCLGAASPTISDCIITQNSAEEIGAGIYCGYISNPKITNCKISDNFAGNGSAIFCWLASSPTLQNCTLTGNLASFYGGAILTNGSSPNFKNCTIVNNKTSQYAGGFYCYSNSYPSITDSIVWFNSANQGPQIALSGSDPYVPTLTVSYSNIQDGSSQVFLDPGCTLNWQLGNIDIDPCFADPGYWDNNSTPDNIDDDIWLDGDFHLMSQAGRWDTNLNDWVIDPNTSRCIDAGNPAIHLADEPNDANNLRIDLGAFGQTAQASRTPYNFSLLSDLENNGTTDFTDFAHMALLWLIEGTAQPADLDRNSLVDLADLALLANDWLKQTTWR